MIWDWPLHWGLSRITTLLGVSAFIRTCAYEPGSEMKIFFWHLCGSVLFKDFLWHGHFITTPWWWQSWASKELSTHFLFFFPIKNPNPLSYCKTRKWIRKETSTIKMVKIWYINQETFERKIWTVLVFLCSKFICRFSLIQNWRTTLSPNRNCFMRISQSFSSV